MKRIALVLAAISIGVSAIYSVRLGAISLAVALAIYSIPGLRNRRRMDLLVQVLLIVSLVTVALALPRR
ncbi:MAG: hypothetical protein EBX97_04580 [Actinobacteria bacterium]|nr:hypothetical protein [Actinomycetota bacterium]NDB07944.1 hypothetical protein [Actinomycetota bacterium]